MNSGPFALCFCWSPGVCGIRKYALRPIFKIHHDWTLLCLHRRCWSRFLPVQWDSWYSSRITQVKWNWVAAFITKQPSATRKENGMQSLPYFPGPSPELVLNIPLAVCYSQLKPGQMPLVCCAFVISVAAKSRLCEMWLGKNTWLWLKSDEGGRPAGANGGSSLGEPVRAALSKVGTKGLLIRTENVRRDASLFPTSAVTAATAAPSTWNVYFCQGIVSIFELFVVVPSEHLCDPPKRQLPQSDQRSRNAAREMLAFQVTGILGNGALRRLGGCCCQSVPSWTTAIIDARVRKHRRDGSPTSSPSSSLVTAIEWPHSFILSGKKSLVSHLPAAFLPHAHLNLLKLHLFWLTACLCRRFPLPGMIFNPPHRQKQTNGTNCQNYIFKIIIFPSHLRSHNSRHLFQKAILSQCLF